MQTNFHQSLNLKKISYIDFFEASNGEHEKVRRVVEIFKDQRMVIISGVKGTREILDRTHHALKEAARNPDAHKFNGSFTVSTKMREPGMMFDQMNNVFPLGEEIALKNADALGVSRDDCFDLLGR